VLVPVHVYQGHAICAQLWAEKPTNYYMAFKTKLRKMSVLPTHLFIKAIENKLEKFSTECTRHKAH
jgi:hypothetical protein